MDNADKADGGRTGGLRRTGGRADGGRTGGQADVGQRRGGRADGGWTDGRTARRMEADGRMRADGAQTGRTGGRADGRTSRGFKRPCTSFPASLSSAQTTRLTASEFAGHLGVHWGPSRGYVIFFSALNSIFAIQAQHYCEVCA